MLKKLRQNLIKGMSYSNQTVLELHLSNLKHNFKYLKSKLRANTKFMAVVKAFAYGNDAIAIAKCLELQNVDYFAVAYTSEGVSLRNAGVKTPILVLHPQLPNLKTIIEHCLEPNLYSITLLKAFIKEAKGNSQTHYPVHLKFNTGLNRLGLTSSEVNAVLKILDTTNTVKVASLFSHLAASEDKNEHEFTLQQIKLFKTISHNVCKNLSYKPLLHLCNTSGIINYPDAHFDMVRSGIGLYGFGNSKEENKYLKPIASLKSVISQIHTINKGESVGYNRSYIGAGKEKTATIPIGHADGISRIYGHNVGYVIINNHKAPILGIVCMDMIMVNVTNIECNEGDEVIIFDERFTAEALAEAANTISYELITSISQRVKRVIID